VAIPPDRSGKTGDQRTPDIRDEELERRRRNLEATLATRLPEKRDGDGKQGGAAGYGTALKLSSEFIAGVAVGAGLGWVVDRFAGTSPWGLIVLLLLGFGAGVLNVLRSAGLVAEPGPKASRDAGRPDRK
jgi:ATP synthase protein I